MSKKVYYKVLTDTLQSVIANNTLLSVEYRIGEWVKPNVEGTDLMVFNTLQAAQDFRESCYYQRIFECEVKNPRKRGVFVFWNDVKYGKQLPQSILNLISLKKRKKKYLDKIDSALPNDTIFCSAVKLIKEII